MSEPLVVHLNRGGLHEVDPATDAYEADGDFEVVFRNHGRAVHVHLKVEGPLSHVAGLDEPNHFVDTDATERVRVDVEDHTAPIEGWLEVVSGYGSEEVRVPVTLGGDDGGPVAVDDELADPPADDTESLADAFAGRDDARVAGFAAVAVGLAVAALVLAPSPTVGLGAAAVLAAVVVAAYLLVEA